MDCCEHPLIELAAYILSHPKWRKAFGEKCTKEDVINFCIYYLKRGNVLTCRDEDGKLTGCILFTPRESEGMVSIEYMLGSAPGIMTAAIGVWAVLFPDCVIYAQRKGKTKVYKQKHFFQIPTNNLSLN